MVKQRLQVKIVVLLVVLAAAVAGGATYYFSARSGARTETRVTVEAIKKIAELATVDYHISTMVKRTKDKKWYEWKYAEFLVLLRGHVKGSVDLKQAEIGIKEDGGEKVATIRFKPGAVLVSNPIIGENDMEVITISDPNVFNKISDADRNSANSDAIRSLVKVAIDDGIVRKTADETKAVLTGFLAGLGYRAQIEFAEPLFTN